MKFNIGNIKFRVNDYMNINVHKTRVALSKNGMAIIDLHKFKI